MTMKYKQLQFHAIFYLLVVSSFSFGGYFITYLFNALDMNG